MYQAQLQISEQDIRTVQPATQQSGAAYTPTIRFGQQGGASDGRQYVFGLNNASTAAVAGQVQTSIGLTTGHFTRTNVVVQAAGSYTVVVPLATNAATQNQYAQGYLTVVSGTGQGVNYPIKSNTAATSTGSTTVTLSAPLTTALDATSILSLYPSPWNLFTVTSTTLAADNVIGVPNVAVPASNYCWLQTSGYCATLSNGVIAKATQVTPSATTAGAVDAASASTITQVVGYAVEATVSTDYQNIFLEVQ